MRDKITWVRDRKQPDRYIITNREELEGIIDDLSVIKKILDKIKKIGSQDLVDDRGLDGVISTMEADVNALLMQEKGKEQALKEKQEKEAKDVKEKQEREAMEVKELQLQIDKCKINDSEFLSLLSSTLNSPGAGLEKLKLFRPNFFKLLETSVKGLASERRIDVDATLSPLMQAYRILGKVASNRGSDLLEIVGSIKPGHFTFQNPSLQETTNLVKAEKDAIILYKLALCLISKLDRRLFRDQKLQIESLTDVTNQLLRLTHRVVPRTPKSMGDRVKKGREVVSQIRPFPKHENRRLLIRVL